MIIEVALTFVGLLLVVEVALGLTYRLLKPLLWFETSTDLKFAPNTLKTHEIGFVILVLVARTAGQALGIWPCHTVGPDPSPPKASSSDGKSPLLRISGPKLTTSMPLKIGKEDVLAFHKAIDNNDVNIDESPGLLMLYLSAISEPAQLLLLAKRQCPIKPLGAVNVCNRFELLQPDVCKKLSNGQLKEATARSELSQTVRPKKRGFEYDLIVEILAGDEKKAVFRQVFTMLEFAKHTYPVDPAPIADTSTQGSQSIKGLTLTMGSKEPSVWAGICKDYNPIHISAIAAKLFGMPGKVAHGNHVAAKAMAALATENASIARESEIDCMEVNFRRPVKVPGKFDIEASVLVSGGGFQVMKGDKVHVDGKYERL